MTDDDDTDDFAVINGVRGYVRGDIVSAVVPIGKLVPMEDNTNEMDERELTLLCDTIKENGFIDPIAVIPRDDGRFEINGGEHRWKAAKQLGYIEVPCDVLVGEKWKDPDLRRLNAVRLNVLHGKQNPDKMLSLYNKVVDRYGPEAVARYMGYTSEAGLHKVIRNVSEGMRGALPPDMAKKFDEKSKKAKNIGDVEKIIQHLFQEQGDTIKYNYLIFSWGGQEHVYIAVNKDVHENIHKILEIAKIRQCDVNDIIGKAIKSTADSLEHPVDGRDRIDPDGGQN